MNAHLDVLAAPVRVGSQRAEHTHAPSKLLCRVSQLVTEGRQLAARDAQAELEVAIAHHLRAHQVALDLVEGLGVGLPERLEQTELGCARRREVAITEPYVDAQRRELLSKPTAR